ncbi:MAG: hypothetical protein ABIR47_16430 [Candidatus Kapaibacterium sp.]
MHERPRWPMKRYITALHDRHRSCITGFVRPDLFGMQSFPVCPRM